MEELKLLAVGDLHGKSCWQAIDFDKYDRIVFLGDYVDSPDHRGQEILENFNAVIQLKRSSPKKVILILGNHDIHYLHYPKYSCSGFNPVLQVPLTDMYTKNRNLFQVAYQIHNHLFSHAGISLPWYEKFQSFLETASIKKELGDLGSLAEVFNAVEKTRHRDVLHQVGVQRGGAEEYGGMTWADKQELWYHPLEGYHQVVGHTPVPFIEAISYNDETSVTFVDVLGSQKDFYEISFPI
ncbi:MAG: metallophosphoesterase [Anditalea sp.]